MNPNDVRIAKLGWEHKEEKNFLERANYVCERICCVGALNEKMLLCDKTVLSVVVVVVVLPNCCLGYHTSEPYAVSRIIFEQSYDFLTRDLLGNKSSWRWNRCGWEEDDSASTDNYIIHLLLRFLRLKHIEEEEEDEEEEEKEF